MEAQQFRKSCGDKSTRKRGAGVLQLHVLYNQKYSIRVRANAGTQAWESRAYNFVKG